MRNSIIHFAPAVAAIVIASGILSFAAEPKPSSSWVTATSLTFNPGITIPEEVARTGNIVVQVQGKIDQDRSIRCELRVFDSSPIDAAEVPADPGEESKSDSPAKVRAGFLAKDVYYEAAAPSFQPKLKLEAGNLVIVSQTIHLRAIAAIAGNKQASLSLECEKDGAEEIKSDDIKKAIPQIEIKTN